MVKTLKMCMGRASCGRSGPTGYASAEVAPGRSRRSGNVDSPSRVRPAVSTYALDAVFNPSSVALVGASPRERSLGRLVLRQLLDGGFAGPVGVVNARYPEIEGVRTVRGMRELDFRHELVLFAVPPGDVAKTAAAAADCGARAVVVLTRGMGSGPGSYN